MNAACLVGACGTCEARVLEGRVQCNGKVQRAGDRVTTCTTTAIEGEQTVLGPANRLNRSQWYVTALIIGAVFFGLWNVPPGLGMSSKGSMNTGHSNLKCESCHKEAPVRCANNWLTMLEPLLPYTSTIGWQLVMRKWTMRPANRATNVRTIAIRFRVLKSCGLPHNERPLVSTAASTAMGNTLGPGSV